MLKELNETLTPEELEAITDQILADEGHGEHTILTDSQLKWRQSKEVLLDDNGWEIVEAHRNANF